MAIDKSKLSGEDRELVEEALKAYGLSLEHVLGFRTDKDSGEVHIVTCGGKKIHYREGQPAQVELNEVEKTGVLPEKKLLWSDRLNQRMHPDELKEK